jgi:hypothetical protein
LVERIAKADFVNQNRSRHADDAELEPRELDVARIGAVYPTAEPSLDAGMLVLDLINGKRAQRRRWIFL